MTSTQTDSARSLEKKMKRKQKDFEIKLEKYFNESIGTTFQKLNNFPKYTTRQFLTTFFVKYELFKKILNIHGSIVECGVWLGGGLMTFAKLSTIFEPVNYTRKIIGFDTFSGFPGLSKEDKGRGKGREDARKGGMSARSFSDLEKCIELYDLDRFVNHIPKVQLVKGNAKRTIPQYLKENPQTVVSLLYLDFDLFEPTKVALQNFLPRMPKGSIIAFDELNNEAWMGETEALLKTVAINNLKIERFDFDSKISYAVL